MKKVFLLNLLIATLVPYFTIAQDSSLVIFQREKLKKGIYRTFEEFKYNRPSLFLSVKIEKKEYEYIKRSHVNYEIKFDADSMRKSGAAFWGYSDGVDVYISNSPNKEVSRKKVTCEKIIYFGRYCFFKQRATHYFYFGSQASPLSSNAYSGGYASEHLRVDLMILDINTGEIEELDKKRMRLLLANDPPLLESYENYKDKEQGTLHYLRKYCERHPEEILTHK